MNINVFDDGGFSNFRHNGAGQKINLNVYNSILELAKQNNIRIPVACTAKFFDIDNMSNIGDVNKNIDQILDLFYKNSDFLEIWNHGLTHSSNDLATEFYNYERGSVNVKVQDESLRLSQKIFSNAGFDITTLVPPGHAWESGVTDRIASYYGINTIAVREFEKKNITQWIKSPLHPFKQTWEESRYVNTIFRLGLGIPYDLTIFSDKVFDRTKRFLNGSTLEVLRMNRFKSLHYPVDHYFAHVQNLQNQNSMAYFNMCINEIKRTRLSKL